MGLAIRTSLFTLIYPSILESREDERTLLGLEEEKAGKHLLFVTLSRL